jgi:predicted nucleotidyltransferase
MSVNKKSRPSRSGLRDDSLKKILEEIKATIRGIVGGDFRLVLFGSRANGKAEQYSDVDLMLILPDKLTTFETEERVRNAVYDFSLKTDYVFSLIIVSETLAEERAGFMVFGAVEKEGIAI